MNLDAAIFDLDGTLIDSRGDILAAMADACAAVGRPGAAVDAGLIGLPIGEIARRLFVGADDGITGRFERAFRGSYDAREHSLTRLYPGVPSVLDALASHGVRLFLATMKPELATARILRRFDLERCFVRWRSLDSWPGEKLTKGELLARMIAEERIDRRRAAYVGDHPNDILAARGCGVLGIAARWGYGDAQLLDGAAPDLNIAAMGDLWGVFAGGEA